MYIANVLLMNEIKLNLNPIITDKETLKPVVFLVSWKMWCFESCS
jgi:hypothetical protein